MTGRGCRGRDLAKSRGKGNAGGKRGGGVLKKSWGSISAHLVKESNFHKGCHGKNGKENSEYSNPTNHKEKEKGGLHGIGGLCVE